MKRLSTITFIIFLVLGVLAQDDPHINFIEGDWNQALEKAAAENKYIVLDAYTEWCGWCKVMDKNTFSHVDAIGFTEEYFVPVRIDMEKGIGIDLAMKYRVSSFPSILYFDSSGKLVYRTVGYRETEPFITDGKAAMDPEKQFDHPGDPKILDPGFPEFYKMSFKKGKEREWPTPEEVNEFLESRDNLYSETSWAIISRFSLNQTHRDFFLDNMAQYRKYYGSIEVDRKFNNILTGYIRTATKNKDITLLQDGLGILYTYGSHADTASTASNMRIYYYKGTSNWERYGSEVIKMVAAQNLPDRTLNDYAWNIYQHVDDKKVINKATEWMAGIVEKRPQYEYLDTYAALLFKAGKLQNAEEYALKALKKGADKGKDTKNTQELLEKIRTAGR